MVSLKQHLFGMMILHDEHHLVQVKRKALKDLKNRGDVIIARGGLGAGTTGKGWPQPNIEPISRYIKPRYIWTYYISNSEKLLVASLMLIYCVSIRYSI